MPKRELQLSEKKLLENTEEDILLRSPSRIPDKGIQNALSLKQIQSLDVAYYDISPTENGIPINVERSITLSTYGKGILKPGEGEQLMGEISDT